LYYEAKGESAENFALMKVIDAQFLRTPFYGVPRMTAWLNREGCAVNEKRVRRLMRLMGIEAIYPKPRLSLPGASPQIHPYLLRGLAIEHAHQVWAIDITYLPMRNGFSYLAAIMDWYSRYVLSWRVSNSLEASFCMECLQEAIQFARHAPEIFNSDQGSQFTSKNWVQTVENFGTQISHDGRGRAYDNIMIERLWRSVKYENVYPMNYETPSEARRGLSDYFAFYNRERPHQALDYRTPHELLCAVA